MHWSTHGLDDFRWETVEANHGWNAHWQLGTLKGGLYSTEIINRRPRLLKESFSLCYGGQSLGFEAAKLESQPAKSTSENPPC